MMAKKVGSHCKTHVGMDPPTQPTMKGLKPQLYIGSRLIHLYISSLV